jgi:hypothetical protein
MRCGELLNMAGKEKTENACRILVRKYIKKFPHGRPIR